MTLHFSVSYTYFSDFLLLSKELKRLSTVFLSILLTVDSTVSLGFNFSSAVHDCISVFVFLFTPDNENSCLNASKNYKSS